MTASALDTEANPDKQPAIVDDTPPGHVLGDQTDDMTAPIVSANISNGQTLSGKVSLVMQVVEANPLEYSISVFNIDGSDVVAGGQLLGVVQNPASGSSLTLEWDTAAVTNGDYRVVMRASDVWGRSQTLETVITTSNSNGSSTFPPIKPVLEPIPVARAVPAPPTPTTQPPETTDSTTQQKVLGEQDQLSKRLNETATAPATFKESILAPPDRCARFFGVCWYVSVPITAIATSIAIAFVRFRQRVI